MSRPRIQPSDDELGALLTETFTAHEVLADPDVAVRIAAAPGRPRHHGRVLLGAAAAVVLVAGGTTYGLTRGSGGHAVTTGPPANTHQPPLPPLQTDAANRAKATAAALAAIAAMPAYPGADETDAAGVPQLGDDTLSSVQPPGHTVVESRFWTVAGVSPRTVAQWYAAHAATGFHSEPGVGGQGDGHTWIDEVYWDPAQAVTSQQGVWAEIETTRTPQGVGVRTTVSSVWTPARPVASYVQDVTSIDVDSQHDHLGQHGQHGHGVDRTFTITSRARILRAARAFDAMPGMTPMVLSCPMQVDTWTDRIVFHTATGDVTAVDHTSACGFGMTVRRGGKVVAPQLDDPAPLLQALGISH